MQYAYITPCTLTAASAPSKCSAISAGIQQLLLLLLPPGVAAVLHHLAGLVCMLEISILMPPMSS